MTMRDRIKRAQQAQQDHEQAHDVQLEIEVYVTAVCSDGMHDLCSGRCRTNLGAGWHEAHYTACDCLCHTPKLPQQELKSADHLEWEHQQHEIHGPGPDCHPED
jgi:hypothetical protein